MFKKIFLVLFCLSSTNAFALYNFRTPTGIFLSYRAMNSHRGNTKVNDNMQTDAKNNKEAIAGKTEVHNSDTFKINDKNTIQEEVNKHSSNSVLSEYDFAKDNRKSEDFTFIPIIVMIILVLMLNKED